MERKQLNKLVSKFKQTLSEQELEDLGEKTGFCQRRRTITPYCLGISLIEALGSGQVETIADMVRSFNSLHGQSVQYKPFHKQLSKKAFPEFMRALCERLMGKLSEEVLRFDSASPFSRFSHILLHDGSSFALHGGLHEVYPGRFTQFTPAAVELHVTMDLLSEMPQVVTLTPDTAAEVHYAPHASQVSGGLLLADRMFFIKEYLAEIARQGGSFVVKARGELNPVIRCALDGNGIEIKAWRNKRLKEVKGKLHRYPTVDMDVSWEGTLDSRLLVTWNETEERPRYLATNLPREVFSIEQVCDAYRLRWQVELMFKEWKSYANLHAFSTEKAPIAEGLIWAALCAAMMKRFLAHAAQRLYGVAISTRKAAMALRYRFTAMLHTLLTGSARRLVTVMNETLRYLAGNAQRAHPERERRVGRLKLGLAPVFLEA